MPQKHEKTTHAKVIEKLGRIDKLLSDAQELTADIAGNPDVPRDSKAYKLADEVYFDLERVRRKLLNRRF